MGYYIYSDSKRERRLDKLLENLTASSNIYSDSSQVRDMLVLMNILSKSLRDTGSRNNIWIDPEEVFMYNKKPDIKTQLYFGLLLEQLRQFKQFDAFVKKIDNSKDVAESIEKMKPLLLFNKQLSKLYDDLNADIKKLGTVDDHIHSIQQINESIQTLCKQISSNSNINFKLNTAVLENSTKAINILEPMIKGQYMKIVPRFIMEFPKFFDNNKSVNSLHRMKQAKTLGELKATKYQPKSINKCCSGNRH